MMKKMILAFILCICIFNVAKAQEFSQQQIHMELRKLAKLKVDCEKQSLIEQAYVKKNIGQKSRSCDLYKNQIIRIKKNPDVYLKYINEQLKSKVVRESEDVLPYRHIPNLRGYINLKWYEIRVSDFYKVVKYSIFKQKDSVLPQQFRGLPVINEKIYNGFDKAKNTEFRIASKFLLRNLSLNQAEIGFVKSCNNQPHILSMKEFLDREGVNSENLKFVKWSIDYLIKSPEVSVGYLINVYDAVKYRDFVPRDEELLN